MRVLALDFDGVISDSAPESFWVALKTHLALARGSRLADDALCRTFPGTPELAAILASPLYAEFVELMPLGNRAEDFGVALAAIEAGHPLPDQAAYDAYCARQGASFLDTYHARFYRERDALAASDPAAWYALLAPYAAFVEVLKRRSADTCLALATAKDGNAVGRLVERYGLVEHIRAELICDKRHGRSKRAHLEVISQRSGAALSQITFIDDKVNHLEEVASLGVRCVLAGWGYNAEREHERARTQGFAVCSLERAEEQLFAHLLESAPR